MLNLTRIEVKTVNCELSVLMGSQNSDSGIGRSEGGQKKQTTCVEIKLIFSLPGCTEHPYSITYFTTNSTLEDLALFLNVVMCKIRITEQLYVGKKSIFKIRSAGKNQCNAIVIEKRQMYTNQGHIPLTSLERS